MWDMETDEHGVERTAPSVSELLPDPASMTASVSARDRRTGDVLLAHNPAQPLPPASNVKLVTAAVALDRLGPEHRFETTVLAVGERRGNRLIGDLVLRGSGAPDLSQSDLITLAEGVRATGIEHVSGTLVLDASAFERQALGPGWTWDDEQFDYGAKSTPIALERNTVDITITGDEDEAVVDASPGSRLIRVDADVTVTDEANAEIDVYKERASDLIQVSGRLPAGTTRVESSPVDDPIMHCGHVFRDALSAHGVSVEGWITVSHEPTDPDRVECASVSSAPVGDLIRTMAIHSDNFIAEQLARSVTSEEAGTGSWEAWSDLASSFLAEQSVQSARVSDGSGMSRYNLLPASGIVSTLDWALTQPWAEAYRRALPVSGQEGTLRDRLVDLPVDVRAKTGEIKGTRTLSGYIEVDDEPAVTFSCLLSNLTDDAEAVATDTLDEIVRQIVQSAELS